MDFYRVWALLAPKKKIFFAWDCVNLPAYLVRFSIFSNILCGHRFSQESYNEQAKIVKFFFFFFYISQDKSFFF